MTAKLTSSLGDFIATLSGNLDAKVLRGALRAGANVIADGAREECRSDEVRATIGTTSRAKPGLVTAKVQTKENGAYKAPWLENGTDPHYISVDAEQSGGRTVRKVNRLAKKGTLVINGQPVGDTVFHPGARPHPFMRPALDSHEREAIDAIGGYITKRLTKETLAAPAPHEDPEE